MEYQLNGIKSKTIKTKDNEKVLFEKWQRSANW